MATRQGTTPRHSLKALLPELDIPDNPEAEPPCPNTKSALIVFERNAGKAITVCIDGHCPVHDPATAARLASEEAENPAPVMEPPSEEETEEEAEQKRREEFSKARTATFERILDQAPAMFTAVQLRTFLRLLVHIDPYNFLEEVAKPFTHRDSRSDPEIDFRKHLLLIIR